MESGEEGDSGIHFGHVVFAMHTDLQEEMTNKDPGWRSKLRS